MFNFFSFFSLHYSFKGSLGSNSGILGYKANHHNTLLYSSEQGGRQEEHPNYSVKITLYASMALNNLYPSTASESGIILSNMNLSKV